MAFSSFLWRIPTEDTSFQMIRLGVQPQKKPRPSPAPSSSSSAPSSSTLVEKRSRLVAWIPSTLYRLVRKGNREFSEEELVKAFEQNGLREEDLFIFEHCDPNQQRNQWIPRYEAVFQLVAAGNAKLYVRSQKRHLAQIYTNAGRTEEARADAILEDKTPYWVDRYIFRPRKGL